MPTITEKIYNDSRKYVYIKSERMHKSGKVYSEFRMGVIIERTPYVRVRYFVGGKPGKNKQARARWLEFTFIKNKDEYEAIVGREIKAEISG